ncbi:imidazole glycerol phosphate synthase cyclase subunit [uncultured Sulfitobacter sp.]|jgi:imidazole glycerol-phosphate synthase subunit HisF|uniref:imidazole glycerol phosphate synthase cyclase subunit n=1 Tax=uncultured Sulfitobacter sp. TaxID=191468 RepID=UPI0030FBABD1
MRLISRIDVKNEWAIKGIHLEGLRKVGDPNALAVDYYKAGVDEIVFMDAVASLYNRNNLFGVIEKACENVFVPITLGGGIRSVADAAAALNAGADKVIINTGAVHDINLISDVAARFGSQCIVGSIEAKKIDTHWEAYIDNGREVTGLDVVDWAQTLEKAGVGELMITSVDKEGTQRGFDVPLVAAVQEVTRRPIIVSGGYGQPKHLDALLAKVRPSAIAVAAVLHYKKQDMAEIKAQMNGYEDTDPS